MSATSAASKRAAHHCDPESCQLTHAEFAAKPDALCLRGNAAVKRADISFEQAKKTSSYTKAAAMESALLEFPPYQLAIQGLTPPAQDRAAFTRYVGLTRRIHELSERILAAGRARDTSEVIRLSAARAERARDAHQGRGRSRHEALRQLARRRA